MGIRGKTPTQKLKTAEVLLTRPQEGAGYQMTMSHTRI